MPDQQALLLTVFFTSSQKNSPPPQNKLTQAQNIHLPHIWTIWLKHKNFLLPHIWPIWLFLHKNPPPPMWKIRHWHKVFSSHKLEQFDRSTKVLHPHSNNWKKAQKYFTPTHFEQCDRSTKISYPTHLTNLAKACTKLYNSARGSVGWECTVCGNVA